MNDLLSTDGLLILAQLVKSIIDPNQAIHLYIVIFLKKNSCFPEKIQKWFLIEIRSFLWLKELSFSLSLSLSLSPALTLTLSAT